MLALVLILSLGMFSPALGQEEPMPSTCDETKTVSADSSFIFKSADVTPRKVMGKCSVEYTLDVETCEAIGVECNNIYFNDFSASCSRGRFLGLVSDGETTKYCGNQEVDFSSAADVTLQYYTFRFPLRPIECTVSCKRAKAAPCECGTIADPPSYPWLASVQKKNDLAYEHVCSGSLIGKQWIMTAATCFQGDDDPANYKILFETDASATMGHKTIDRIEIHPLFQVFGDFWVHDLALVRLAEESELTPICWPSAPTDIATTIGWGNINAMEDLTNPMEGTVEKENECQEKFDADEEFAGDKLKIICSMACVTGTEFCNADFGSPGMATVEDTHIELHGVASFTGDDECAEDLPGVFTNAYDEQYWWKSIVGFEAECVPPPAEEDEKK